MNDAYIRCIFIILTQIIQYNHMGPYIRYALFLRVFQAKRAKPTVLLHAAKNCVSVALQHVFQPLAVCQNGQGTSGDGTSGD